MRSPLSTESERPRLIDLVPPTDEQRLSERFPKNGLVYDPEKIIIATQREASRKRSRRWRIKYYPNLKQAEVLFSRDPEVPSYAYEGLVVRQGQLSVYFRVGESTTSQRATFTDGIIGIDAPREVRIAAMRSLRTLRLAPQVSKSK